MKRFILVLLILCLVNVKTTAQKIDSIYVNLYTDSLKKGTYNYINIDGLLSSGHYLPLDSTHISFSSSAGVFSGNSLWIDNNFSQEKVTVKVVLKNNPGVSKQFDVYIKKKPDNEKLKTAEEILNEIKNKGKSGKTNLVNS